MSLPPKFHSLDPGGIVYGGPNGIASFAPEGSTVVYSDKGEGIKIKPPGSTMGSNVVRLMAPDERIPNGYAKIQNAGGQYVNSNGVRVDADSAEAHIQPTGGRVWSNGNAGLPGGINNNSGGGTIFPKEE